MGHTITEENIVGTIFKKVTAARRGSLGPIAILLGPREFDLLAKDCVILNVEDLNDAKLFGLPVKLKVRPGIDFEIKPAEIYRALNYNDRRLNATP